MEEAYLEILFRETLEDLLIKWDMMDIFPEKEEYTCSNQRNGSRHITGRLDRFLIHINWLVKGIECTSSILDQGNLDQRTTQGVFRRRG